MRTTLDIDPDVLQAIKELAHAKHTSAGAILSDLARQTLTRPGLVAEAAPSYSRNGVPLLPQRPGEIVTLEHIQSLDDGGDQ